jgi:hypothetical protein
MGSGGREIGNKSEREILTIDKKGIGNMVTQKYGPAMKQKMGTWWNRNLYQS